MTFVAINLAALTVLISMETLVLKAVLRESAWLARLHRVPAAPRDALELALGAKLPAFSLPALGSSNSLTDSDIRGTFAVFLFIRRADIASNNQDVLRTMVRGLFNHVEECLYVVCECSREDALWIRDRGRFEATYGVAVKVLVDESSHLRTRLGIASTPSCAIFDEDGSLKRVGHPFGDRGTTQARHAA